MNPTFRVATTDDTELIAALGARTFEAAFGPQNDPEDMAAYLAEAFHHDAIRSQLADPGTTFLLAELDAEVVGFSQLRVGSSPESVIAERPLEVARFYADVPWIGRGIGTAIMAENVARAQAADHDALWLSVWQLNPRAIEFYTRWGFEVVGETTFIVGSDVQHDFVMQKQLG